jgi:hypothetical protein
MEYVRLLPEQLRGDFLLACVEYCLDGRRPQNLSPDEETVFAIMRPLLQRAVDDERTRLRDNARAAERMRLFRQRSRNQLDASVMDRRNASVTQDERQRNAGVTPSASAEAQADCEPQKGPGATPPPTRAPLRPPDKECPPLDIPQRKCATHTKESPPSDDQDFSSLMTDDMRASRMFMDAWAEWLRFRRGIRKRVEPCGARRQLGFLARHSLEDAVAIMEQSMMSGWQGLFELDRQPRRRAAPVLTADAYTREL